MEENNNIRDQLQKDLHAALKQRDTVRIATIRLILAVLKDRDIAQRGEGKSDMIDNQAILAMMRTMVKQRLESIRIYEASMRHDRAQLEQKEIDVIESYLPLQWDEKTYRAKITEVLKELKANHVRDMGRVMSHLKQNWGHEMDMTFAGKIVRERLLERKD